MLKKITLENYRCFQKTEVSLKDISIVVGKNNAGKSTLIEALRILSVVVNRFRSLNYVEPPSWLHLQETTLGIQPSITNLDISTRNIFYMYGDSPSKISAEFTNGCKVFIYIGEDAEVFAVIYNKDNKPVESKRFANVVELPIINILPQITPLLKQESVIKFETVQRNLLTNLSSRNFRNQLNYFNSEFEKFKDLSEKTWKGLHIHSNDLRSQGDLLLFVREGSFEAEIGWMGHGLQMWLQTMWFLSRCTENSTVILDEPDVYMHADLQRRLIKLVKERYNQVIIATHSIEIMSEVEPSNILPINSSKLRQEYANKAPIVQKIVDDIGSVHNIEIARIFSYNKFLVIEGEKDDIKLLSIFQSKIFPDSFEQFDILPKIFVEGWGGWQRVIGSNKVFKENKSTISLYCIFDSDYHLPDEISERLDEAKRQEINLHVWEKKEIENYLLVPSAITRAVTKSKKRVAISDEEVSLKIEEICDSLKDGIIEDYATSIQSRDKGKVAGTAYKEARAFVNEIWEIDKYSIVPGKKVISLLCQWTNEYYKVSINKFAIAREMLRLEIPQEIIDVISRIETRDDFC
ncbi:MAG TPA: AAA family ATPase [Flavipsychrobacter sp.]|nr:AAA family ATPase [Flavipsychrobacter sp.]